MAKVGVFFFSMLKNFTNGSQHHLLASDETRCKEEKMLIYLGQENYAKLTGETEDYFYYTIRILLF